jgi:hypothetical protein
MAKGKETPCGCMKEKDETPEYEAKSHSRKFLKKAAALAERKLGGRRREKKRGGKSYARKRV